MTLPRCTLVTVIVALHLLAAITPNFVHAATHHPRIISARVERSADATKKPFTVTAKSLEKRDADEDNFETASVRVIRSVHATKKPFTVTAKGLEKRDADEMDLETASVHVARSVHVTKKPLNAAAKELEKRDADENSFETASVRNTRSVHATKKPFTVTAKGLEKRDADEDNLETASVRVARSVHVTKKPLLSAQLSGRSLVTKKPLDAAAKELEKRDADESSFETASVRDTRSVQVTKKPLTETKSLKKRDCDDYNSKSASAQLSGRSLVTKKPLDAAAKELEKRDADEYNLDTASVRNTRSVHVTKKPLTASARSLEKRDADDHLENASVRVARSVHVTKKPFTVTARSLEKRDVDINNPESASVRVARNADVKPSLKPSRPIKHKATKRNAAAHPDSASSQYTRHANERRALPVENGSNNKTTNSGVSYRLNLQGDNHPQNMPWDQNEHLWNHDQSNQDLYMEKARNNIIGGHNALPHRTPGPNLNVDKPQHNQHPGYYHGDQGLKPSPYHRQDAEGSSSSNREKPRPVFINNLFSSQHIIDDLFNDGNNN